MMYGVPSEVRSARVGYVREADRDLRAGPPRGIAGENRGGAEASVDAFVDAIEAAVLVLGRRWRPSILCLLLTGPQRYNALLRRLPGATPKMLTQQLKALEDAGFIDRVVFQGGARRTEYALSPVGEALRPVLDALREWAAAPTGSRAEGRVCVEREVVTSVVTHADADALRVG
jgi:DNA-binding HxlR family transcriptional regulator